MPRLPPYTRLPFALLTATLACGDNGSTTEGSGTDASTSTTNPASTTGEPTSEPTSSSATANTSSTSGETTTTGTTDATTDPPTTTDATTGDPAFCHGWDGAAGTPHLEIFNDAVLLADGGTLALECGGQGLFMFGLYPTFGGFTPAGDGLTFEVTVDVEGHNSDPNGHFFSITDYIYYVGCDDQIGGVLGVVPVLPPDNEDPLVLDGLAAHVEVILHAGADLVSLEFDVTLSVDPGDPSFRFCGG